MTGQTFGNILRNFLVTVTELVSSLWSMAHRELQQFCVVVGIYSE